MVVKFALQFVALTFVRTNELLLAHWDEIDLQKAIWKIPAERMKMRIEHLVPLSKQALGLLQYIKKIYPSDQYVLCILQTRPC
jgi:integrase